MFCHARVQVGAPDGLHLRPASRIAELASDYPGEIRMRYGDQSADAQSVLDLLSLRVPEGGVVFIEADRFDAPYVVEQIRLLTSGNKEKSYVRP